MSNHRDIVLDASLLNLLLILNGFDTSEIAIGNNLLIYDWISDLVRLNKSFIVKRDVGMRQMLDAARQLSGYIHFIITQKHESVWIAQREGRSKDSDDRTQESLIKMLGISGEGDLINNLKEINIVPVSISYEYDPCDYLKAHEFLLKRDNPDYKKQPQDDLISMQTGVMGYKGKVVYTMTGDINNELQAIASEGLAKSEVFGRVAELIDSRIHANYNIFTINKIAYDLLAGNNRFEKEYTVMEKLDFERYLEKQLLKIELDKKDDNFLMKKMLEMYSNPLINYLQTL
jgi:hypothetical protein